MKQENRPDQQKLKDLLKKKPEEAADDFEKEALEGFAMLADEKEVSELKDKTDRKVFEKLMAEESKAPVSKYWYAAAGLLLCIGLSVFLVTKENKINEKDLAIRQETSKTEPQPPSVSEQQLAEEKQEVDDTKSVEAKDRTKQTSSGGLKNLIVSENKASAPKSNSAFSASQKNENEDAPSAEPAAYSTTRSQDAANVAAPAIQNEESAVAADQKAKYTDMDHLEKESKKQDRVSEAKPVPESSLGEVEIVNTGKAKEKTEPRKKTADKLAAAPSAQIEAAIVPACFYAGGPDKLNKELKKQLRKKNLDRSFGARVFVNTQNKVEKTELTTENIFSAAEKEELDKILKELNNFKNTTNTTTVYTLEYKQ